MSDEPERMVLVGTRYGTIQNRWSEWSGPFDEVLESMIIKRRGDKVASYPCEVVEVVVVRKTILTAEVHATPVVTHEDGQPWPKKAS